MLSLGHIGGTEQIGAPVHCAVIVNASSAQVKWRTLTPLILLKKCHLSRNKPYKNEKITQTNLNPNPTG